MPILIGICFVGCTSFGPARTCDEITGQGLQQIVKQTGSPEEIRKQIADAYALSLNQVALNPGTHTTDLDWSNNGIDGSLQIEETHPLGAGLHYSRRPPSADEVIGCLGAPDYYESVYQGPPPEGRSNVFTFSLYFARQGIAAGAFEYHSGKVPPNVSGAIALTDFAVVPIGSPQETMDKFNRNATPQQRAQIKMWPGGWQDLTVTINSDFPPE